MRDSEDETDKYEDMLGTYLLKLGAEPLSDENSEEVTELLKLIGDFERIGDHAVNVIESAEELHEKQLEFSRSAKYELSVMSSAVCEVLDLAVKAFKDNDAQAAKAVEPLEQVVDDLKNELRTRHILRMKKGECSIEAGFVWSDLLTDLERASDHCSNIALCVLDMKSTPSAPTRLSMSARMSPNFPINTAAIPKSTLCPERTDSAAQEALKKTIRRTC